MNLNNMNVYIFLINNSFIWELLYPNKIFIQIVNMGSKIYELKLFYLHLHTLLIMHL